MAVNDLSGWLKSPTGAYVLEWELNQFDALVGDIFGYNALQIGLPTHDLLRNSRISHHFSSAVTDPSSSLRAVPQALPIASASIDLVILPHVLEFSRHPHQVLREVERVLVPDGSVLISGFNPFSLFGLRRLVALPHGSSPWCGHYFSVPRLRDWLTLLGFETDAARYGCFAPPVQSSSWIERWRRLDRPGSRWWRVCGGVFMLHGIKRVHGMRLITPNWRDAPDRRKALAPMTRQPGKVAGHSRRHSDKVT